MAYMCLVQYTLYINPILLCGCFNFSWLDMAKVVKELEGLIDEEYVPSSLERKKAVLMYFFVGIVFSLSKDRVSVYELFHLKQSV